jgi:hypothetical protein
MARQSDPQTLKRQALLALHQSREALTGSWAQAREQWSPRQFIQNSMEKHRMAMLGMGVAAAVVGFLAVRWLMPGRENSRDTFSKPARKRSLVSFLLSGLWSMGREPLKALALQQLAPLIAKVISHYQPPQPPPPQPPVSE